MEFIKLFSHGFVKVCFTDWINDTYSETKLYFELLTLIHQILFIIVKSFSILFYESRNSFSTALVGIYDIW